MILIFHTDGTAMWQWKLPADDPAQPHLLRLATVHRGAGFTSGSGCALVRPAPGATIDPAAQAFHGIDVADAVARGQDLAQVVDMFDAWLREAALVVAFNLQFHKKMMDRAAAEVGRTLTWPQTFCAMQQSADIVRVKLQSNNRWAWPKLETALAYFSGEPIALGSDPVEGGLNMVRAVRTIYDGILRSRAQAA